MTDREDSVHEDSLKQQAAQLAERLCAAGDRERHDLLESLGLLPGPTAGPGPDAGGETQDGATRVGIWRSALRDGEIVFERFGDREEWLLWADVPVIPARSRKKRVVFLGESVARGYFYDPSYTPARALEAMLGACGLAGGAEVLDLARTNLGPRDLMELLPASLNLQPDALVIFAANNWQLAHLAAEADRRAAADVLRQQGAPALRRHLEARLGAMVRQQIAGLGRLAQVVPVVFVIPEFNLADWRPVPEPDAPYLQGGDNPRWLEAWGKAQQALEAGDLDAAATAAETMIELDGASATTGLLLLADVERRRSRTAEARRRLEQARDAQLWDSAPQSPRPLGVIQDALRETLPAAAIAVVDLPRIFARDSGGELPGRKLFVDYCHLTAEGIGRAMAAVARELAPRLGGSPPAEGALLAAATGPATDLSAAVEGQAHFLAAIHNAHWGQPAELVRHHCAMALEKAPDLGAAMLAYLELQIRRAPVWMCRAAETVRSLQSLHRYVFSRRDHEKLFDEILIEAVLGVLEERGESPRVEIEALRLRERGLTAERPLDLLDVYHRRCWMDRGWLWLSGKFFRAYAPVSRFPLLLAQATPSTAVSLSLTARLPGNAGESRLLAPLQVNGEPVEDLSLHAAWQSWSLTLPAGILKPGLNAVEIHWPGWLPPAGPALEKAAEDLEAGRDHDLRPAFGEIHSFHARLAG